MQTRNAKTTVTMTSLISVAVLAVSILVISARLGPAAAGQDTKPSIEELRAGKNFIPTKVYSNSSRVCGSPTLPTGWTRLA
jgi:hypothetical protein